ncbi:hypothetical protein BH20ACT15_BH20ACT15_07930 [soil metagenome]
MSGKNWLAPLTGVAFIVLLIVSFVIIGEEPPGVGDDSAAQIVDFYSDKHDSVIAGAVIQTIAAAFFVFFGATLFKVMRAAGAEASAMVGFAGTAIFAVGVALDGTVSFALAEAADDVDPVAMQTLAAFFENDFLPFSLGLFVFLMGLGVAIIRHGVFPKWMGWVAAVASLTAVSPAFPVAGVVGLLAVLITSIMLAMRERSGTTA